MPKQPIADVLNEARVAINNAQADPAVQAALAAFGYTAAKFAIASTLLTEAELLTQQQMAHYGAQFAASQAIANARQEASRAYRRSLKVARVAFADDLQASAALMLNGRRQESLAGWLQQTTTFYSNLLADPRLLASMAEYGYTEAKLTAEQTLITAVQQMDAIQEQEKGEARTGTRERDAKLAELKAWMATFRKIAAVALADEPQKLQILGFSNPT